MDEHEPFPEDVLEPDEREDTPAPTTDPEVPEADAIEQSIGLDGEPDPQPDRDDLVPEADALEQSRVVEVDDEDRG
jgi:hypothetical protein